MQKKSDSNNPNTKENPLNCSRGFFNWRICGTQIKDSNIVILYLMALILFLKFPLHIFLGSFHHSETSQIYLDQEIQLNYFQHLLLDA